MVNAASECINAKRVPLSVVVAPASSRSGQVRSDPVLRTFRSCSLSLFTLTST